MFPYPRVEELSKGGALIKIPTEYPWPLGLGRVNLYEKVLGKKFLKADLEYLKTHLPLLFIEDTEITIDLKSHE